MGHNPGLELMSLGLLYATRSFLYDLLKAETKLVSESDLFSGYKNALSFTGTLSDELGRFLPASFLFLQSYPTIEIHQSTGWITVSVLDIHTLQVPFIGLKELSLG